MSKNNSIVIVAHKFLTQPDDDLVIFLNDTEYENVLHIRHSFNDAPDRKSYYSWYKKGKFYKEVYTRDYKGLPEPLIYVKELLFTLFWIIKSGVVWNKYIGMDGLVTFFGEILKFTGKVKSTVYWVVDFVPDARFGSVVSNFMYKTVNTYCYKHSDEVWDLSPRMFEAREKFWSIKESDYKKRIVVPYGVWVNRIKKCSFDECERNTLVFMGHLIEKQGVQLVIEALPEIVKIIPDLKFKIIGGGRYKESLEKLANDLNVMKYCKFLGKIDDDVTLENEIAKSVVAIAPYIKELDTWTYYADPGKIKKYLACGVPVLLTDIPWNAKEIQDKKCGFIIKADKKDIVEKVVMMINKDVNEKYRKSAVDYAKSFNYENIFKGLDL